MTITKKTNNCRLKTKIGVKYFEKTTNKKNKTYPDDPFMLHTSSNFNDYTNETYHIDFLIKRIFYEEKKNPYS